MAPIYFTIDADRVLAIHAEELIFALGVVVAVPEIPWFFMDFDAHVFRENLGILAFMHLLIAVVTKVDLIILAVERGRFATGLAALVQIHKRFFFWRYSELD